MLIDTGADPASQFDLCTIRLLKDRHMFSPINAAGGGGGGGGGGAFLHFKNLTGNLVLTYSLVGTNYFTLLAGCKSFFFFFWGGGGGN